VTSPVSLTSVASPEVSPASDVSLESLVSLASLVSVPVSAPSTIVTIV
jgi:hypothetical protein